MSSPLPVTTSAAPAISVGRVYYPALDGLRAVALFLVFFQHYIHLPWGWTGVQIFFVLSGFLITGILLDTLEPGAGPRPHPIRNFYIRRTLRIFPLYYGVLFLPLLLAHWAHWSWSAWWFAWPLYLGNLLRFVSPAAAERGTALLAAANASLHSHRFNLTFSLGHFWSLCLEEQFYLLWPWVIAGTTSVATIGRRKVGRTVLLGMCIAVVIASPLLRVAIAHLAPAWMLRQELLYRLLPFQMDSLLLGSVITLLWRMVDHQLLLRWARIVAALTAVLVIAYLALTLHLTDPDWCNAYVYPSWVFTWGLSFINLTAASVILCALRNEGWIARVLGLSPLRWAGRISYGAYIFHDIPHIFYLNIVSRIIYHFGRSFPFVLHYIWPHAELIGTLVALACTLLLAALSYRFYESGFLRLKQRLAPSN